MIVYPSNWQNIGQSISVSQIKDTLISTVAKLDCPFISFSGGLDSTLMLYMMLESYTSVDAFTIGLSDSHPDVVYSRRLISKLGARVRLHVCIPSADKIASGRIEGDFDGDDAVRHLYTYLSNYTDRVIACDGIDEFMCGYFKHQENPTEEMYYNILSTLRDKQLSPLNINSGDIKVFLPYLDVEVVHLLSQVPVYRKVDTDGRKRLMFEIANGYIPNYVTSRRKYGMCDAFRIKEELHA